MEVYYAEYLSRTNGRGDLLPACVFNNTYDDEWITDPLTVEMIRDVDKSKVVAPHLIESPVLGPISVKEISGGVKTLILMAFDDTGKIFNASACGDNCAKWILKIEEKITIIRGDSATGKTTLIDMIWQAQHYGDSSGIDLISEVPCRALTGENWKLFVENAADTIFLLMTGMLLSLRKSLQKLWKEALAILYLSPEKTCIIFRIVLMKYMDFAVTGDIVIQKECIISCIGSFRRKQRLALRYKYRRGMPYGYRRINRRGNRI